MDTSNQKDRGIAGAFPRRVLLNGVPVPAGAPASPPHLLAALQHDLDPEKTPGYYPPALTGLRGSHVGGFEVAHSVRDGDFWETAGQLIEAGESFDLIVVGGGISWLSAARFFRKSNPNARILILENHDDFGGHAKRNEFTIGDRRLLGFGGTFSIESPAPYSSVAKAGVKDLGIDVAPHPKNLSKGLSPPLAFFTPLFFHHHTHA